MQEGVVMLLVIAKRGKDVYFLTKYGFFSGYGLALKFNSVEEAEGYYKTVKPKPVSSYTVGICEDVGNKSYLKERYIEKL